MTHPPDLLALALTLSTPLPWSWTVTGGRYLARFYLFRTPINDTLFLVNATGVINGTNAVPTPHRGMTQRTREATFLDLLLYRPQFAPLPSFSMMLSVMLPKSSGAGAGAEEVIMNDTQQDTTSDAKSNTNSDTTSNTSSDTKTDTTAQGPGIHDSDDFSKRRYWSNKITVLRTLNHPYSHNIPTSASANEFEKGGSPAGVDASPQDVTAEAAAGGSGSGNGSGSGSSGSSSTNHSDIMHAVVISVFSLSRYREAEVMLKSLFMHRTTTHPLVLHMIVDPAGREHFTQVRNMASSTRLSAV